MFFKQDVKIVQGKPCYKDTVIGCNMNGHISSEKTGYERVNRGYGLGERILDFALANDL